MPAYFDSSVLLSLILGDVHAQRAQALWHEELERVSSILLPLECSTVLRRVPGLDWSPAARERAHEQVATATRELALKPVDEDIANLIRSTEALSQCRTLDAIHVATALFFRSGAAELRICTFDTRMADVASRLGFQVVGTD